MIHDYRHANLSDADRALCDYAVKLTLSPASIVQSDIDVLRDHGFNDDQITIAVQVISYFNYINRVADGLDVEPEEWMTPAKEDWLARKATFI